MDFEFPLQLAVTLGLVLIVILLLPSSLEVLLTLMLERKFKIHEWKLQL